MFIIVPAYNEEKRIGRVVRGLFEQGLTSVVVVDDGSTDRTGDIARDGGAVVLRHAVNRGQGAALETGNEYARQQGADYVVHFDGDGQFNPADIMAAVKLLRERNLDLVIGSRFLDTRSRVPWFKRHVVLPISRWINFLFTGLALTDVHNGFRILSSRALQQIVITHDGMAHNSEIIAQIKKQHLAFAEHPVEVQYHEYGQGVRGGLKIVWDLIFSRV